MSVGASSLAHGVHYMVLAVGVLGLVALLGPHWISGPSPRAPRDEHEARVAHLHQRIATGSLATPVSTPPRATVRVRAEAALPIAVISSTAAAAVHAAVVPAHVRELLLFGLFFTGSAVGQLVWSVLVARAPSRRLLLVGATGNSVVLVLWLITRTIGLPFGMLPKPEEVGRWDLCCGAWEAVVVIACIRALRREPASPVRVPRYDAWPRSAQAWMFGSILTLMALSISGAGS
jgi:hypothetical protein